MIKALDHLQPAIPSSTEDLAGPTFAPATKAHPAYIIDDLDALAVILDRAS